MSLTAIVRGYCIGVGVVTLPDATPAGGNIILGLAVWNTPTTFATMLTTSGALLGVIAFPQVTVTFDPSLPPTPPNISAGWLSLNGGQGQQLVMMPIPEPSSLALLGVGIGAFLAFCWRRERKPTGTRTSSIPTFQRTAQQMIRATSSWPRRPRAQMAPST